MRSFSGPDGHNSGWKGRGVWTTSGDRASWLKEGGKGTVRITFHFQFRPNPLADWLRGSVLRCAASRMQAEAHRADSPVNSGITAKI
jgi:hypothetical protein